MVVTFSSVALAASGNATYYAPPYVPSSCYGYQDNGVMIAAASDAIWDNRAACGRMYSVRCTGAGCRSTTVTVMIVDYCPTGCQATMDLSQEAFAAIADLNAGLIQIEYNELLTNSTIQIPCIQIRIQIK
ncbi:hypothetical protein NE237_024834 [Protea cynaroides]|uniref:Expansin-like EG45 domain-containing protein n=1 Tax=Protea cynaroides TaxID=273540 RepID=A0A9Q0K160_9MAGN|nr:hypothetical protein NE237_024834 [Protea cynaroides]